MKLKLDENLGRSAADLLRAAGHDVATVVEQKLAGAADANVIAVCQREGRGLVSLDMDFANPLKFEPRKYPGIAVLRLPAKPSHGDLAEAVRTLVGGLKRDSLPGKLWIVSRGNIREYEPDI